MVSKIEIALFQTVAAVAGTLFTYLLGVGIYTLFNGNSYLYNLGYSIGYISGKISSLF